MMDFICFSTLTIGTPMCMSSVWPVNHSVCVVYEYRMSIVCLVQCIS